jgi:hypothetical protein
MLKLLIFPELQILLPCKLVLQTMKPPFYLCEIFVPLASFSLLILLEEGLSPLLLREVKRVFFFDCVELKRQTFVFIPRWVLSYSESLGPQLLKALP